MLATLFRFLFIFLFLLIYHIKSKGCNVGLNKSVYKPLTDSLHKVIFAISLHSSKFSSKIVIASSLTYQFSRHEIITTAGLSEGVIFCRRKQRKNWLQGLSDNPPGAQLHLCCSAMNCSTPDGADSFAY
ncbi:hypothetical protein ATANTOWER_020455 [Ataeniobius toweri]|uniref:Secreted protein n=1 Tax=Ataeniobius toweri TaxID=208326 RepID=A0ABU7AQS5_9TELE|nr:hypothetical protein [Ataeniobius toweri]